MAPRPGSARHRALRLITREIGVQLRLSRLVDAIQAEQHWLEFGRERESRGIAMTLLELDQLERAQVAACKAERDLIGTIYRAAAREEHRQGDPESLRRMPPIRDCRRTGASASSPSAGGGRVVQHPVDRIAFR